MRSLPPLPPSPPNTPNPPQSIPILSTPRTPIHLTQPDPIHLSPSLSSSPPPTPPQRHLQTRQARARGGRVHPRPRHPLALRSRSHQAQVLFRKRRQAIRQGTQLPHCFSYCCCQYAVLVSLTSLFLNILITIVTPVQCSPLHPFILIDPPPSTHLYTHLTLSFTHLPTHPLHPPSPRPSRPTTAWRPWLTGAATWCTCCPAGRQSCETCWATPR